MRFVREVRLGLLLACLPIFSVGCASLSPKFNVLPSIARNRAETQFQAAQNAERHFQWQKARELYIALQRSSPSTPIYAHRMGVVCTQLSEFDTATKYFEHALELDPQNPVLLSDMGYSCYLQRDYVRAEKLLAESVRLKPDDPRAVNNLAMAIGFQGRFDECLATFQRVNNETQSLLNIAYIHTQKNEPERAIAAYQRVLTIDPANRIASNALPQLQPRPPAVLPVTNQTQAIASSSTLPPAPAQPSTALPASPADEIPASRNDWTDDHSLATVNPAFAAVTRPAITSASEIQPEEGFQPPIIAPFNTDGAPAESPRDNKRLEINIALSATAVELPRQIPIQESIAEPRVISAVSSDGATNIVSGLEDPGVPAVTIPPVDSGVPMSPAIFDLPPPPANPVASTGSARALPDSDEVTELDWAKPELEKKSEPPAEGTASVRKDDCFRGFCPVAIRDERRLRSSSDKFTADFQGQTFRFSSAEALIQFQEHPEWYVPMAGGLDVVDFKQTQSVSQGSLDFAVWFRHRLHMFSSAENLAVFRTNPRQFAVTP